MSLIGIIRSGDVVGAIKKVIALAEGEVETIETQFPILGQFIDSLDNDIGKAVLKEGAVDIAAIRAGTVTVVQAAETFVENVWTDAIGITKEDAITVAANGIGVLLRAPAPPAADPAQAQSAGA